MEGEREGGCNMGGLRGKRNKEGWAGQVVARYSSQLLWKHVGILSRKYS